MQPVSLELAKRKCQRGVRLNCNCLLGRDEIRTKIHERFKEQKDTYWTKHVL